MVGGALKNINSEKVGWALKSNLFPVRALKIFLNQRSEGVGLDNILKFKYIILISLNLISDVCCKSR